MDKVQIKSAALVLEKNGVVGMPTETVYGLAARIDKEEALKKIFSIKERPFFDPLIVHISSFEQKDQVVSEWSTLSDVLAKKFWPGPLTLVLKKNKSINPLITSGLDTVGVRFPSHPVAQRLIETVGVPLAAPSANKFKKTSPTRSEHVKDSFPDVFVLDGGESEIGLESSVVEVNGDRVSILRPGAITYEMIDKVLKESGLAYHLDRQQSALSPGHLEEHYQPDKPLVILLVDSLKHNFSIEEKQKVLKTVGYDSKLAIPLELSKDPQLAARYLYHELRRASQKDGDYIELKYLKEWQRGLWEAIWDRVKKAATHILSI